MNITSVPWAAGICQVFHIAVTWLLMFVGTFVRPKKGSGGKKKRSIWSLFLYLFLHLSVYLFVFLSVSFFFVLSKFLLFVIIYPASDLESVPKSIQNWFLQAALSRHVKSTGWETFETHGPILMIKSSSHGPIKSSWFRVYKNIEYSEKVLCENQTTLLRSTMLVLWKTCLLIPKALAPWRHTYPIKISIQLLKIGWIYTKISGLLPNAPKMQVITCFKFTSLWLSAKPAVGRSNLQWAFHLYVNVYQRVYINTIWLWLTVRHGKSPF